MPESAHYKPLSLTSAHTHHSFASWRPSQGKHQTRLAFKSSTDRLSNELCQLTFTPSTLAECMPALCTCAEKHPVYRLT
ncbi:hypothetical protein FGO68_gene11285 [Halteria grandinella]|uniref:Uncharacterized protein n=1 Tax=Halteria grandinella TaxID=5974 RepID=A0A8J8NIY7_HALGN|nr:hypothetical protein FGO68_gene11285 [Halteria grandinella]